MNYQEAYEKYSDEEFLTFDKRVINKLSSRADLHAFILLDKLVPGNMDIIGSAEHDEIWIDIDPEDLSKAATEEQMIELIRCGLRYNSETDSLAMFV